MEAGVRLDRSTEAAMPLIRACEGGHLEIARYLVEQDANIEARDHRARTPLHAAAFCGHLDIVQFLISLGCNKDSLALDATPLDGAIARLTVNNEKYPLDSAARQRFTDVAIYLIKQGAITNTYSKSGTTGLPALITATRGGLLKVVKALVDAGEDVTVVTPEEGYTPLHIAALYGHLNLVRFFVLETDAPINSESKLGFTPLLIAKIRKHQDIAAFLATQLQERQNSNTEQDGVTLEIETADGDWTALPMLNKAL